MATKVKLYDEDGHIVGFQDSSEGGGGSSSANVEIIDVYLDNGQTEIEKSVAEMFVQKIIDGTVCLQGFTTILRKVMNLMFKWWHKCG